MTSETFSKSERLCSRKAIADLFEKGKSFYCPPFQVIWLETSADLPFPSQVAFSVPKKKFKTAVSRNLIKRRIREAYRKQKHILYDHLINADRKIVFMLIFKGETVPDYTSTEKSVKNSIDKLVTEVKKTL